MTFRSAAKRWYKYVNKRCKASQKALRRAWAKSTFRLRQADITLFHEFSPPPGGGGHQFLKALWREFEQRGWRVENNMIAHTTRACLLNSFNFQVEQLRRWPHEHCRIIHRVVGPIKVYRGWDDGTDARIQQINEEFADATIFQSQYSLKACQALGLQFKAPQVILNATDPQVFHSDGRIVFDQRRKIRLISTSWSDNPNKGAVVYKWLEKHLDWTRFEYTFVGRSPVQFERIRMIPPSPTQEIARLLRQHDIYITASQHESCSNSLLEALSCGLPALYIQSGSNGELVNNAGLGFFDWEALPELLSRLVDDYEEYQANIVVPTLTEVATQYLSVMGLTNAG